jgi:hypothetical protein
MDPLKVTDLNAQAYHRIRMYLMEIGLWVWIGFDWLRIGTSGGLL